MLCLLGYNKHFCLKQFVNQIYDLRSSIVHDGAQISTYKHIKKFQKLFGVDDGRWIGLVESKLRDVVRQAILKVLEHIKAGGTMSSLNEKLEEKLLQSL